jgi:hypothetical protein
VCVDGKRESATNQHAMCIHHSAADGVPVGPDTKPALLGLGLKVDEEQTVRALVEVCKQVVSNF